MVEWYSRSTILTCRSSRMTATGHRSTTRRRGDLLLPIPLLFEALLTQVPTHVAEIATKRHINCNRTVARIVSRGARIATSIVKRIAPSAPRLLAFVDHSSTAFPAMFPAVFPIMIDRVTEHHWKRFGAASCRRTLRVFYFAVVLEN